MPTPDEDDATLDRFLARQNETRASLKQFEAAARADDKAKLVRLSNESAGFDAEQERLAKQYGFTECGVGNR